MNEMVSQDIDTNPFREVHWQGQRVLLATSDDVSGRDLFDMFSEEDMSVQLVKTANDAQTSWENNQYDLLVIDAELEGGGLNVGHSMKFSMKDDFVPLLYITPHKDEISMASCFEAGGDDLVVRPYSLTLVFSRINALLRMGGIYREQFKAREEIAYYHSVMEEEQVMAESIFSTVVHQDHLNVDHIQYTLSPMSIFNGDMLLAANTPDGHEYILLGDFTGHGLKASIGSLPASEIFYGMTLKGFSLSVIISEINERLRHLLPIGMFMASFAIDVDPHEQTVSIWGGGIPDLLFRKASDNSLQCIKATHLPLGVLPSDELGTDMLVLPIESGDRIYIYTDGITETENKDAAMFGSARLEKVVSESAAEENIFSNVMQAMEDFRDGFEQSDDITILEYTFSPELMSFNLVNNPIDKNSVKMNTEWDMNLHLDIAAIKCFDPRPLLMQLIVDVQGMSSQRERLFTILSELFKNSVDYGLLSMKSSDKDGEDGIQIYNKKREDRLAKLEEGEIIINLKHIPNQNGGVLSIEMEDSGPGFDVEDHVNSPEIKKGGLTLIEQLADDVTFIAPGNKVRVSCEWFYA